MFDVFSTTLCSALLGPCRRFLHCIDIADTNTRQFHSFWTTASATYKHRFWRNSLSIAHVSNPHGQSGQGLPSFQHFVSGIVASGSPSCCLFTSSSLSSSHDRSGLVISALTLPSTMPSICSFCAARSCSSAN